MSDSPAGTKDRDEVEPWFVVKVAVLALGIHLADSQKRRHSGAPSLRKWSAPPLVGTRRVEGARRRHFAGRLVRFGGDSMPPPKPLFAVGQRVLIDDLKETGKISAVLGFAPFIGANVYEIALAGNATMVQLILGIDPTIAHAVKAHHFDVEPSTDLAMLTICADAISASRPGARRDTLAAYLAATFEQGQQALVFLNRRGRRLASRRLQRAGLRVRSALHQAPGPAREGHSQEPGGRRAGELG